MTDLQTSLIAIGGVIVVGVIFYNKWQENKAKKGVERAFASFHDDVLMGSGGLSAGARHEPYLSPDALSVSKRNVAAPDDVAQSGNSPMYEEKIKTPEATLLPLPLDALIDCMVPFTLGAPLRGEKILAATQSLRSVGGKPVQFVGKHSGGEWEAITHGGVYVALTAGVQLANRAGALNELEYSEFVMQLRQIADEMDAEPDAPDMTEVMLNARAVHHFVAQHDAKIGINIQSNAEPWRVSTLLSVLERQGFEVRPEGRLVMPDEQGGVLFSLSTNVTLAEETTHRLTLLLDVPAVSAQRDGFGAMVTCAHSLAELLDGTVVDDDDEPLSDAALTEISGQIETFQAEMACAGIAAGSIRALRLFH